MTERRWAVWLATTQEEFEGGPLGSYPQLMAEAWARRGHAATVFVYHAQGQEPVRESWRSGVRVIDATPLAISDLERRHLARTGRMGYVMATVISRQITREGPPDVLEMALANGLPHQLLARRRTLCPIVKNVPMTIHLDHATLLDQPRPYHLAPFWAWEMERYSVRHADLVTAPWRSLIRQVAQIAPEGTYRVLPDPLVPPTRLPESFRGVPLTLWIGPGLREHDVSHLLSAVNRLRSSGSPWTVRLADFAGRERIIAPYRAAMEAGWICLDSEIPSAAPGSPWASATVIAVGDTVMAWRLATSAMALGKMVIRPRQTGPATRWARNMSPVIAFDAPELPELLQFLGTMPFPDRWRRSQPIREFLASRGHPDRIVQTLERVYARLVRRRPRRSSQAHQNPSRFSVVIPYFNAGAYVSDAIESALAAARVPAEIIIVDDGSTDAESLERLNALAKQLAIVRVLHRPHHGIIAARQAGIRAVRTPFVALLDADDRVHPTYWARALDLMQAEPSVAFVGAWIKYFGAGQGIWPGWDPTPPYILYHNTMNSSGLVARTSALLAVDLRDKPILGYDDYALVLGLLDRGYHGVVIPEPLFEYRIRDDSRSKTGASDKLWPVFFQAMTTAYPALYRKYAVDVINLLNANGPQHRVNSPLGPLPDDP